MFVMLSVCDVSHAREDCLGISNLLEAVGAQLEETSVSNTIYGHVLERMDDSIPLCS